jgi:hypothetical protein
MHQEQLVSQQTHPSNDKNSNQKKPQPPPGSTG